MAIVGLSIPGASSKASTAAPISSPAGSIHIARGPPNRAIAPASSASTAGSDLSTPPEMANFSALPSPASSRSPRARDPASSAPWNR
jgi:hypothetical protein